MSDEHCQYDGLELLDAMEIGLNLSDYAEEESGEEQ